MQLLSTSNIYTKKNISCYFFIKTNLPGNTLLLKIYLSSFPLLPCVPFYPVQNLINNKYKRFKCRTNIPK